MPPLLAQPDVGEPPVDDTALATLSLAIGWGSRYVALLAACLATGGSLFFSAQLGWLPCTLCWYQRILMYPLSVLIAVGILRRDNGLLLYALPFSVVGAGVSLYHYLLIKTDWFPPPPCRAGVPCTVDYIDFFGFINIPFLALTAFLTITLMMVVSLLQPDELVDEDDGRRAVAASRRWGALPGEAVAVFGVVGLVAGAFVLAARLI